MKYMARRPVSGLWLSRDVELGEVERTRVLSGPSTISAKIDGSLAQRMMSDGRPFIDDWGTYLYAVDEDTGRINAHGMVMPPTNYDSDTSIVCAGYSSYPKGLIYRHAKFWGPQAYRAASDAIIDDDGVTVLEPAQAEVPELPRPLSVDLYREHWEYVQTYYSNLGVVLAGATGGGAPLGTYADPYRLQYWDSPDIGDEMERLAKATPFDYVEEPVWIESGGLPVGEPWAPDGAWRWPTGYGASQDDVRHYLRLGLPRLGRRREDLRFATGENIALAPPINTTDSINMVLGIGNGDPGPSMAQGFAAIEDGRVKRIAVVTDKTLDNLGINDLVNQALRRFQQRPKIDAVAVADHSNARLSSIDLGDDIRVQGAHPQYGQIDTWVRVISITEGERPGAAVLAVMESTQFTYRAEAES